MTQDEQEAQSWRYSRAFFVLPLSSGWIAVLDPRHNIIGYAESWESAKLLGEIAIKPREEKPIITLHEIPDFELDL